MLAMGRAMKTGALEELRDKQQVRETRTPNRRDIAASLTSTGERLVQGTGTEKEVEVQGREMGGERGGERSVSPIKRRGSDTDILKPVTQEQVQAVMYANETAPRALYFSSSLIRDPALGRYLCPFPACGQSYRSKDMTFEHLKTHEQRVRLFSSTPLQDSLLSAFWPAGSPWLEDRKYTQRCLPPGAIACTYQGCSQVFSSTSRLAFHVQSVHKATGVSSILKGYFSMEGIALRVPPSLPPLDTPVHWCHLHLIPLRTCTRCMDNESLPNIPRSPFQFYEAVTIDFDLKTVLLTNEGIGASGSVKKSVARQHQHLFRFVKRDASVGVLFQSTNSVGKRSSGHRRGRVVGMLVDREKNGWLALNLLLGHHEADAMGITLPSTFNRHHELIPRPVPAGAESSVWVPIGDVEGYFHIYLMSGVDFQDKLEKKEIPRLNTYFVQ